MTTTPAAPGDAPATDPDGARTGAAPESGHSGDARAGAAAAAPTGAAPEAPGTSVLDEGPPQPLHPRRSHEVSCVVVAHDGAVWLGAVLTTLAAQVRPPDLVVGVDTGSTDASPDLLRESLGDDAVVRVDARAGFGTAVAAGLERASALLPARGRADDVVRWVWLLHDDSAPDPDCLRALLDTADDNPGAAVLGPKVRGWHDRRLLLEAGVTIAGSGRRETGLERREHDQGQHDGVRDVLAVSTAGMLIRRELWERLGGLDPALPLFRDDVDLCWRAHRAGERVLVATDAVVHHREAAYHGRRAVAAGAARPHRADREAALHVLLAQAPAWRLPLTTIRLVLGSLLRVLGYLVGKDAGDARDELVALGSVLVHPGRVLRSRALAARTSVYPASVASSLRPRPGTQARQAFEALGGVLSTGRGSGVAGPGSALGAVESGPVDDAAAFLDDGSSGWLRRTLARPGVLLALALVLLAVVAARSLWFGAGSLLGGTLLPAPPGSSDLLRTYTDAWHEVGPGSATPAPPYLAVLAAIAFLLLGKAPLAVEGLLLLAVPLAGVSAYLALRGVVRSDLLRGWAAAAYALLPAVTGAVAAGRLGTAAVAVLLPPTARLLVRCAGVAAPPLRPGTARTAWSTALLLAVLAAFVPGLWLLALVLAVAAGATVARDAGAWRRLAIAVLVPVVLLLPWSAYVAAHPVLLLLEPGRQGVVDLTLQPWHVALLHPGGPGMTPVWVTAGLVVAAFVALLRGDRRRTVLAAWVVALVALTLGIVQSVVRVLPPGAQADVRPWPGPATLLMGLALVVAAAVAVDGFQERFSGASFGWRQPATLVVIAAAAVAPLLSAGWYLPDAGGPLRRDEPSAVPAFVAADAAGPGRPRTLVLRTYGPGDVVYSLVDGAGPVLGDAETGPPAEAWDRLDPIVAALAAGRAGDEVEQLAGYAVRYVQLADTRADALMNTLDSEPGLRRVSTSGGEALWRVDGVTSRVRLVDATGKAVEVPAQPAETDAADGPLVEDRLPAGAAGRTLVVAERADPGWTATGDGAPLPATPPPAAARADWAQGFTAPAGTPEVVVAYDGSTRTRWLWLQFVLLLAVVVLALPARREEDPDPDVPDESAGMAIVLAAERARSRTAPVPPAPAPEEES